MILVLTLINVFSIEHGVSAVGKGQIDDYRSLRYDNVVPQSTWSTCGPAAVATLLTYFFDMPATEAEIVKLALHGEQDVFPETGFSLLSLKRALQKLHVESKGYRLGLDALIDYFERGGLPLILHVAQPEAHFVVAIGIIENAFVVLADPSIGLHALSFPEFANFKAFTGHVLLAMSGPSLMPTVTARQSDVLRKFTLRYAQLASLGRRF